MTQRLAVLSSHISSFFPPLPHDNSLQEFRDKNPKLDSGLCKEFYFINHREETERVREHAATVPVCHQTNNLWASKDQQRRLQIARLAATHFLVKTSFEEDKINPFKKMVVTGVYTELDETTATMSIVLSTLYIDALQNMGTQKHREFIDKAYTLEELGCFAVTELGHGSNVSRLETTATFNLQNRVFTFNSPTATSAKWWIGGLAKNAVRGVVFANLVVKDTNMGVHAFVIPLRDDKYDVLPGLIIGDCGTKVDLNGIDNGFLLFNNYVAGYDCLLDKFSQITPQGEYTSAIKSKEKRLGVLMSGLIRGRIGTIFGSESNLRSCLTIAVRYAVVRRQFSEEALEELRLIDYPLHRYRLMPYIAKMMAINFIGLKLLNSYSQCKTMFDKNLNSGLMQEHHSILSAAKALSSWYALKGCQQIRESLGGHGYSAHAGVGRIRNGQDMHTTWEGDNVILLQQTSKFIMKQVQKLYKGLSITNPSVAFLSIDLPEVIKFKATFETPEELRSEQLLTSLLEYRVNYLLGLSVERLKNNVGTSSGLVQAWNKTMPFFLQSLSKAYGELAMAKAFFEFVPKGNTLTHTTYLNCFYLFCANCIHENAAVFLEHCFSAKQVRAVEECITGLVNELTGVSVSLLDAIGVKDFQHGSTIGTYGGQVYAEIIKKAEGEPDCYTKAEWVDLLMQVREMGRSVRLNK